MDQYSTKSSLSSISFNPTSVPAGSSLTGSVHLTKAAPAGGALVTLALNNPPDPCVIPASVTVPAGATTANFAILTKSVAKSFVESIWGHYVATQHASFVITVGTAAQASTPTFSLAGGNYTSALLVSLASSTLGAVIHYTTDGTTPTNASPIYTTPISVSVTTTIKAVAVATGYTNSVVASATYTISAVTPTASVPTFSPAGGTYTSAKTVSLSCSTVGATIRFTLDGSTPTASSAAYASPFPISITTTVKAIAMAAGYLNSAVGSAVYTISVVASITATPTLSPAGGSFTSTQSVSLSCSTAGSAIHYTLDGTTPTASSPVYTNPISVSSTTTVKAIGITPNYTNSTVASATYTIGVTPPPPGGSLAAGLGTPTFMDLFAYASNADPTFLAKWVPQIYSASNYAGAGSNFSATLANIQFVNGMLRLALSQPTASSSSGAEILSAKAQGYGTYEFCVRFGSTATTPTGPGSAVSGGVSATFLMSENNGGGSGYVEIDAPEVEGNHPWAEYDNWFNSDSGGNTEPSGGKFVSQGAGSDSYLSVPDIASAFHFYGLIWSPGRIDYYLDGVLQGSDTSNIPTPGSGGNTPGIDINHYGCNSSGWGGSATVGVTRYMYVSSVKFWAA